MFCPPAAASAKTKKELVKNKPAYAGRWQDNLHPIEMERKRVPAHTHPRVHQKPLELLHASAFDLARSIP
jgi:hypothetical protein